MDIVSYFSDIKIKQTASLAKWVEVLTKKKNFQSVLFNNSYLFIASRDIILNSEIFEAKKAYYKASKVSLLGIKLLHNHYPQYKWNEQPPPSLWGTLHWGIIPLLLADNEEDLYEFATISELIEGSLESKHYVAMGYALKYLLLGDKAKAKEKMGDYYSKTDTYGRGLAYVVAGILHSDLAMINEGIEYEIKYFRSMVKNWEYPMFAFICEPATAWVKLAQLHGFEPDTSNELINKELLIKHNNIIFDDIIDIYEALEIEGYKKKTWFKKWLG
ncbi:hypothetical protein VB796_15940 [Arcicella sp. LKC2W]|uniref:hypothetical protein n=1 Tax=Arcicella sp. LKC2W TaxID=2984198 RepID=UPI002B2065BF|nr:hypothetical protein [Arcicella sp. LKC2W]MEA5460547.1 hypothetical protein [Arcicella sp. LKC2W]